MKKELPVVATLVGITILSGMILSRVPDSTSATAEIVDDLSVVIASSCSLSSEGGTHTATVQPGGTVDDIGTTDMAISCNDRNGWAIYAIGFGNNTEGNTNLASGSDTIPTGTSGDAYWAMVLSPTEDTETSSDLIVTDYQSYHSVPSSYDKVASSDSDTASLGDTSISTFYKVHASVSQAPGTYTGQVKYVLVHPSTSAVCGAGTANLDGTCVVTYPTLFAGKGVQSVTFTSTNDYESQTISSITDSALLIPGVAYLVSASMKSGWKLDSFSTTAGSISSSTDNPTTYVPADQTSATITISSSVICNPGGTAISNIMCLQDITSSNKASILASMTAEQSYTLYDSRDGGEYRVAKLADGKIWMQDNLRLGGASTIALTPSDTNIVSNFTLPASTSGRFYSYTVAQINSTDKDVVVTAQGYAPSGKVGVYYNYCAATAGTYCYASGSATGDAQYDICPKGWRMPTGGSNGEYQALYSAYGSAGRLFIPALSVPLAGLTSYDGTVASRDSNGYFWSSTLDDYDAINAINVRSTSIDLENSTDRYMGLTIRCTVK